MKPLEFVQAHTLEEALRLLAEPDRSPKALAGGSDVLGTLKDRIHPQGAELLVDLKTIPGLEYIREDEDGLAIGALTPLHTLETDPLVRDAYPLLAEAARSVASPQLRNRGTVAGNLCQEPRCWYYRHPDNYFFCTRKGGRVCNALTGENRYHSLFGSAPVGTRPCTAGCPGGVAVPEYMELLRAGEVEAAARTLLERNPFPAITGRVCPHTCEQECNRGPYDDAVSIRAVERYLGDHVLDNPSAFAPAPLAASGKSVGIVGSGPAGLAAAFYLRKSGHAVTVYEKQAEPGGMTRYAIPAYRLPVEVVRSQVAMLQISGVEFRCGVEVGTDITLDDLRSGHDAVLVAIGAWGQPGLGLENEDLLSPGLPFLRDAKDGLREKPGDRVVVIGGGNVAVDVALTAKRLDAAEVAMVCLECEEELPALSRELEQARAEGVELLTSWGPASILTEDGRLAGLDLVRCTRVFDDQGTFNPQFDTSVRQANEADKIFLAIGQRADLAGVDADGRLRAGRAYIQVDPDSQETELAGVFAAGDVASGPATVIAAIAAGRRAARAIEQRFAGERPADQVPTPRASDRQAALEFASRGFNQFNTAFLVRVARSGDGESVTGTRSIDLEDMMGLHTHQVSVEANRCFNCGCVAAAPSDLAPALLALDAVVVTTRRSIPMAQFFMVGVATSTVLEPGELVLELRVPRPGNETHQVFQKFRIRNAIDFPIVDVATVLTLENGRIKDGRLALGAVAPVPIRAYTAEAYLRGKELSEPVVERAADLAVQGANPLSKNLYKLWITRALVVRSLTRGLREGGIKRSGPEPASTTAAEEY